MSSIELIPAQGPALATAQVWSAPVPRACGQGNVVRVELAAGVSVELGRLQRHF
jgi:hypothetical protein